MRKHDRDRFVRLANKRVPAALKAIQLVGNLANRTNYDFTEQDASKIIKALEEGVAEVKDRFQQKPDKSPGFELK